MKNRYVPSSTGEALTQDLSTTPSRVSTLISLIEAVHPLLADAEHGGDLGHADEVHVVAGGPRRDDRAPGLRARAADDSGLLGGGIDCFDDLD